LTVAVDAVGISNLHGRSSPHTGDCIRYAIFGFFFFGTAGVAGFRTSEIFHALSCHRPGMHFVEEQHQFVHLRGREEPVGTCRGDVGKG
jgi:hypothetical protein